MLVLLQNTYNKRYAGREIPRKVWERLLVMSVSWRRLKLLGCTPQQVDNASPTCGSHASHRLPWDETHVVNVLISHCPKVCIGCGREAESALSRMWPGPLLCLPHPAHFPAQRAYVAAAESLKFPYGVRLVCRTPNSHTIDWYEIPMPSQPLPKIDWPLICLAHDVRHDLWYPCLFEKHPHYDNAHRYRCHYVHGFKNPCDAMDYANGEFKQNVDRHANHVIDVQLDQVFDWDPGVFGAERPDPGPWVFKGYE